MQTSTVVHPTNTSKGMTAIESCALCNESPSVLTSNLCSKCNVHLVNKLLLFCVKCWPHKTYPNICELISCDIVTDEVEEIDLMPVSSLPLLIFNST